MGKVEIEKNDFEMYSLKILDLINKNERYFFYFSSDPDAVGVSIAFALFLNTLHKSSAIFIPEGFDKNLDFLFKIAEYNNIKLLRTSGEVVSCLKKAEYVFVTCDTPTYRLLPDYKKIVKVREKYSVKRSIEIDHHFGGDSEQIYPESETLFCIANSCCDIIANFLQAIGTADGQKLDVDRYFPRNIVLSLIVGICYDTQFGKFLVNEKSYAKWFGFLSERLKTLTWESSPHMKSASEVFNTINKMSEVKIETMSRLVDSANYQGGVGLLILPPVGKYESLATNGDPSCIVSKITSDIANMLPEQAGSVGIFTYFDDIKKQYFIKIRRSSSFKNYDLRDLESLIKKHFTTKFAGGGGHPGATSFRLDNMRRNSFIAKMHKLFEDVVAVIGNAGG